MTDDERSTTILDALDRADIAMDQEQSKRWLDWMLRLMHLNPAYESPAACDWILRVLYYQHVCEEFGMPIGPGIAGLPLPEEMISEINKDLENPPPGLFLVQLVEDMKQTNPRRQI